MRRLLDSGRTRVLASPTRKLMLGGGAERLHALRSLKYATTFTMIASPACRLTSWCAIIAPGAGEAVSDEKMIADVVS